MFGKEPKMPVTEAFFHHGSGSAGHALPTAPVFCGEGDMHPHGMEKT